MLTAFFENPSFRSHVEKSLPQFLPKNRWFLGKTKKILNTQFFDILNGSTDSHVFSIIKVEYEAGAPDYYFLPILVTTDSIANKSAIITEIYDGQKVTVCDFSHLENHFNEFLHLLHNAQKTQLGYTLSDFETDIPKTASMVKSLSVEQSNTSFILNQKYVLKVIRKIDNGENPESEISRHLGHCQFTATPKFCASTQYKSINNFQFTLMVIQQFAANQGNAWEWTLKSLTNFNPENLSSYYKEIEVLALRTAQMHKHLAAGVGDFKLEAYTEQNKTDFLKSLKNSLQSLIDFAHKNPSAESAPLLKLEKSLYNKINEFSKIQVNSNKIRIHGDYHLGQVLYNSGDFFIIDFEGEPARPMHERRLKHPALKDLAGMLRSFDYAAQSMIKENPEQKQNLIQWRKKTTELFLKTYVNSLKDTQVLPTNPHELSLLLEAYIIEKALYEVQYEMSSRPHWLFIPITGLEEITEGAIHEILF